MSLSTYMKGYEEVMKISSLNLECLEFTYCTNSLVFRPLLKEYYTTSGTMITGVAQTLKPLDMQPAFSNSFISSSQNVSYFNGI